MARSDSPQSLAEGILAGEARALGRALTWVEAGDPRAQEVRSLLPERDESFRLGLTGAPGVGKSSLVAAMLDELRRRDVAVAVLAVDPTSPISGGALLGDRIRMSRHAEDRGVFIRSLASRTGIGGIAASTDEAADLLAGAGYPIVLMETVGVGQLEMEIVEEADSVWLLLSPESGDAMQLLKGGIAERVDRWILNQCDRPGADRLQQLAEELAHERGAPAPLATSCETGEGIADAVTLLLGDAEAQKSAPDRDRRLRRVERRLRRRAERVWVAEGLARAGGESALGALAAQVEGGTLSLSDAVEQLSSKQP